MPSRIVATAAPDLGSPLFLAFTPHRLYCIAAGLGFRCLGAGLAGCFVALHHTSMDLRELHGRALWSDLR